MSVNVRDSAGRSSTNTQTLTIKDKYVVALGDSIASGEGVNEAPPLDQVETLRNLTGRTPTEVYMSAGANDFGFGTIAGACARASSMWSSTSQCAAQLDGSVFTGHTTLVDPTTGVNQWADFQQGRYYRLSTALTNAGIPNSRVMISQYPDPTKNDSGGWCDAILDDTPLALGRINQVDVVWAGGVVNLLNSDVNRAAQFVGWKQVNVQADYQTHGYCANSHWIDRYGESNHDQGNIDGSLHPNAGGTAIYATRIGQAYAPLA